MERLRRSRFTLISTLVLGVAFAAWTFALPTAVDGWWPWAPPSVESAVGQLLTIVAGATAPAVVGVAMALLAWWMARRRFFATSGAILLAMMLSWSGSQVVKHLVARARPESPFDWLITQGGFAYPSTHMAVWSAAALMVATVASTMRRRTWPWILAGAVVVVLIAADRLAMGAHHVSDVVGGALLGTFAASLSNLIADVHVLRNARRGHDRLSAAVIYNPVKVVGVEAFRDLVAQTLKEHGYAEALWLPTAQDDPGIAMAKRALDDEVDLVLVAGGDGTVRVVLGELAGTGQKVGILPSGTGNLLARNLDIPLDLERALWLALDRDPSPTDLVRANLPDGTQHAAVLAGVGLDADIMMDTNEELKRAIGPAAYIVAGARHLEARPMRVVLTMDDNAPVQADASLVSIGNVGELQKGVAIMPSASAHDGMLDVLVATPHNRLDMAQMITDVLFEAGDGPSIARYTGRKVRIQIDGGAMCQIDGDVVGRVEDVTFEVQPGAVQLVIP